MRHLSSIAPDLPDDVDVYLVLDDFGERLGRAWRESCEDRIDRRTVITDLMEGQYSDPFRVVAFNTAEGWSRDVSEEIADEVIRRYSARGEEDISAALEDFLDRHGSGRPIQLPLPLRGAVKREVLRTCDNCRWVCEARPDRPWVGERACDCGAPGDPCPTCNHSDSENPPAASGLRCRQD